MNHQFYSRSLKTIIVLILTTLSFNLTAQNCTVTKETGGGNISGTFRKCLWNVGKGDTIFFDRPDMVITHKDLPTENWDLFTDDVTIMGNNTTLDGSYLYDPETSWKENILLVYAHNVTINDIHFTHAPNNSGSGGSGLIISSIWDDNDLTDNLTLNDCEFSHNTSGGIWFSMWSAGAVEDDQRFNNITLNK